MKKITEKMQELLDEKVYMLVGSDVVSVLEQMDRTDIIEDEEKLEDMIMFIDRKMEIPWMEYLGAIIEIYLFREDLK